MDYIQFEWTNNGNYLEFHIYENKCEMFFLSETGRMGECEVEEKQLNEMLKSFFRNEL